MIPDWILLAIIIPIFIVAVPIVILGLTMPRWYRDWTVKKKFNVETVEDKGEVYSNGKRMRYESHRLLVCSRRDKTFVYVTERIVQGNGGLGSIHSFYKISDDEAHRLIESKNLSA